MTKISRSKIDLFLECPRCFYLDKMLGIPRPSGPGFSLNSAVDVLLKNEFDALRKDSKSHELMKKYNIDAIPYTHPDLDTWRTNFTGAQYLHKETGLLITGAIDDIWINSKKDLHIVDYKSTSTAEEISLDSKWKQGYKRQMEVYQWIFKQNGFPVSDIGYFVFANATKNRDSFDAKLEFEMSIIPYKGNTSWIENTIIDLAACLNSKDIPEPNSECVYCSYVKSREDAQNGGGTEDNLFGIDSVFEDKEGYYVDMVEKTPAYKKVEKEVEAEAEKVVKANGLEGRMGACHTFWEAKKEILKKKYRIDWRDPAELNPGVIFD